MLLHAFDKFGDVKAPQTNELVVCVRSDERVLEARLWKRLNGGSADGKDGGR